MPTNPRHLLNLLVEGQASGELTTNEFLEALEQLKCGRAISRTTVAQPGAPAAYNLYILPASPTGAAWAGNGNKYAWFYNGAWRFIPFAGGDVLFVDDEQLWIGYNPIAAAWTLQSPQAPPASANPNKWLFSNGSAWVGAYLPAFFSWAFQQPNPTAINTAIVGYGAAIMTGTNNLGFPVPAGKTCVILSAALGVRTGATAGTYTVDGIVQDGVGTQSVLCTGTGAANVDIRAGAENIATGIYALAGPNSIRLGWLNRSSSPGALAAAVTHVLHVSGLFI